LILIIQPPREEGNPTERRAAGEGIPRAVELRALALHSLQNDTYSEKKGKGREKQKQIVRMYAGPYPNLPKRQKEVPS